MKEQNYAGDFLLERMKSSISWDMTDAHTHNCHEVYYLLSGKRRYFVGHTIYSVEAGDLVVIPKGVLHRTSPGAQGEYERYVIYFSDGFWKPLSELFGREDASRFLAPGCVRLSAQGDVRRLFETMEREYGRGDARTSPALTCSFGLLAAAALRESGGRKRPERREERTEERIQEAARYISENFQQEITLRTAASVAFMEETYFSKQFKRLTGFGFYEYLSQLRLRQAAELLRNSALSVGKIAEMCGYSGGNYFGDAFRKQNGLSPTQYRKRFQK